MIQRLFKFVSLISEAVQGFRPRVQYRPFAKHKAKRAAEKLALYRDWPPDLVDTFIDWEQNRNLRHYFDDAPPGYVHWKFGQVGRPMPYSEHLANPREGVRVRRG